MIRVRTCAIAIVVTVVGVNALVQGQTPVVSAARTVRAVPITVGRLVGAAPRGIDVVGIVQDHRGLPVPNAGTVHVRELQTGTLAGSTEVNALAQFSLRGLPPGLYSVELVSPAGSVLATTPAFAASAGQVVQVSQVIPAPPMSALTRVVRSATAVALSTAASSGVLAIRSGAPLTPGS